jgi:hypothetical protein
MSAFGSTVLFLTCYFHVIKNVLEWLKHKPEEQYLDILNDINNIHFSMSSTEFINKAYKKWTRQGFEEFKQYFLRNWIHSNFCKWQVFHTKTGYASTNNPVENFNGDIKKTYTQRKRSSIDYKTSEVDFEKKIAIVILSLNSGTVFIW